MHTILVGGGNCSPNLLQDYLQHHSYDILIAVDKGLEIFHSLCLIPNYVVGDFDSVSYVILETYQKNPNIVFHEYPSEKDETDMEIGLQLALDIGSTSITILGGIGSRFDHSLANIHLLTIALRRNIPCVLLNETNQIQLVNSSLCLRKENQFGKYISLLPLSTQVVGITLSGFKYPLSDYTLSIGKSIGISNEIIANTAIISLRKGILIVIQSKD